MDANKYAADWEMVSPETKLSRLLAEATKRPMTPAQEREQRISFVHGNVGMSNPSVTRRMVERAVDGQADIAARITTDITDAYAQHARFDNPAPEREQFDAANDNSTECTRTGAGPRIGDWIQTASGKQAYPMDLRPSEIDIADIAHSLANQCRYTGHCLRFYSVAEHSVLMARHFRATGMAEYALPALLHDATEAYLTDVPRPVKPFLQGYKEAEQRAWLVIAERFGLAPDLAGAVHEADNRILVDERAQNMAPSDVEWEGMAASGLGVTLEFWTPEEAEAAYLGTFWNLVETMR